MPSHFVSNDALHDYVVEYSTLLDHFSSTNGAFAEKFASFVVEDEADEEVDYSDELYKYVATETAEPVTQHIPDRDLESVVNLAVFIILQQEDSEKAETLIKEWFKQLISCQQFGERVEKNKKKTLKALTLVSNLSAVYNFEISAELKKWLLTEILNIVIILNDPKTIQPFIASAETIFSAEDADEESRELLVKAATLYASADELESLRVLQLAATQIQPPSAKLIEQLIIKSLNASKALDLTHLTTNTTITQNAPQQLITLLEQYHTAPYSEFASTLSSAASQFAELNTTTIAQKNKLLTLLTLAQQEAVLPYATIAEKLQIEASQVELTLIDAIKRGALEGKMSQTQQEFHVHVVKVVVKKISGEDWKQIREKLVQHKKSLAEVKSLIENVQKKHQKKN